MEVWPRRLEALRTARSSAMASSSSKSGRAEEGVARFWEGRCCLREAWPLRGLEGGLDGLRVCRRVESKGVETEGAAGGGAGAGAEEDLIGMEGVKLMVGRRSERVLSPLVEGGECMVFRKLQSSCTSATGVTHFNQPSPPGLEWRRSAQPENRESGKKRHVS